MVDETLDLRELLSALYRRKGIIVLMVVVSVLTAYVASSRLPRIYEASTTLLVKDPRSSGEALFLQGLTGLNADKLQNYVELARSRTVAERTAAALGYDWDVHDPEFAKFRESISVQLVSGTETIRISVQGEDPVEAARIANAAAQAFIDFNRDMNRTEATSARLFIEEQLQLVEEQLREAELALQIYREEQRVLDPVQESRLVLERITQLESQYAATQLAYEETLRRLDEVRTRLEAEDPTLVSSTTISNNPMVTTYRSALFQLETELAGLLNQYSEQHPQVQTVRAKIAEVERQLSNEVERIVSNETRTFNPIYQSLLGELTSLETDSVLFESRLSALENQIMKMNERLEELPEKELQLARLIRDQSVAEQIYLLLRNRYEEVRITEAMQTADVMVIDPSVTPRRPIKPRVSLNVAIAAFLGLFVGVGLAFVLEFLDTSIKSVEEAEAYLDLPVMGRIPSQEPKEV
ncbi:MAG: hypothetical protein GX161_11020, partial [Firmicutes bacterium]|jgi:polysaccharide chain length determinant protein (PEP-CTERM system associated)|nr:hypothetical protein [Bacillota bacterium]